MKKVLKIAAITLAVIIGLFLSAWGYLHYNTQAYADTAVPYVKDSITLISSWEPLTLKERLADEVRANTKDDELAKLMKWFAKLGPLRNIDEPEFTNLSTSTSITGDRQKIITYVTSANYANGDAQITIRLLEVRDGFRIYQFHLNSNALID